MNGRLNVFLLGRYSRPLKLARFTFMNRNFTVGTTTQSVLQMQVQYTFLYLSVYLKAQSVSISSVFTYLFR